MTLPLKIVDKRLEKLEEHSKRVGLALRHVLEEFVCKATGGSGCTELLVNNPGKLRDLLVNYYEGDTDSVKFIIKEMYLVPLFILADEKSHGREEYLAELFIKNPEAFKNEVKLLLEKIIS
ncbi:hypothetical protein [Thermosphaera sp.]